MIGAAPMPEKIASGRNGPEKKKQSRKENLLPKRYQPLVKRFNLRIKERIAEDEGRAANVWVARGREIVSLHNRCEELMGMG
ncbi:hypothetical protein SASPL_151977 [Salvia splendens]|uniref:Uncharacterized protein n=1 Tax=Salvia splendens TaxID=180675 RepID=A0A8X8Z0F8_SALSN|nr:hypothetical protein SASPL_151977 [Salvia splendens]